MSVFYSPYSVLWASDWCFLGGGMQSAPNSQEKLLYKALNWFKSLSLCLSVWGENNHHGIP